LPVLLAGRYSFYLIYHNDQQSFGVAEIDQMILYVGNAADGEVFTFGSVDNSGADLNWGSLGNLGFMTVPSRQTLSFRGEIGNDRWGSVRWNPDTTGPASGEGIDLFLDGNYDWYTFNAGIPGPNATYVDDLLIPNLYYYGQHTLELAVRPSTDSTAGVLIDVVSFQFDTPRSPGALLCGCCRSCRGLGRARPGQVVDMQGFQLQSTLDVLARLGIASALGRHSAWSASCADTGRPAHAHAGILGVGDLRRHRHRVDPRRPSVPRATRASLPTSRASSRGSPRASASSARAPS